MIKMENECMKWTSETREIFPKLNKIVILADYKKMSHKKLGCVQTKIEQKIDFDPESLLLGKSGKIKQRRLKPKEFRIFINQDLQKIKNPALRKEIVQHVLIHELLHIESEDLFTISKSFNRRKKKKIHIKEFEEDVFQRYNQLRELKGIMQIQKREHLQIAIQRILESINWHKK